MEAHDYVPDCECQDCLRVTVRELRAELAALRAQEPAAVPDDVDLWSFLRDVLKRGAAVESQFSQQGYETFISEIEAAARKEDSRLRAMLASTVPPAVKESLTTAAPAPAAVPDEVANLIPPGWVFYSVDASIQSSDPRRPMKAMIKRDVNGVQWWLQRTEEEKEATPLYSAGEGMTLTTAIQNAVAAMLAAAPSATQEKKP